MPGAADPAPKRWVVREFNYATKEVTFEVSFRRADSMERCFRTLLAEHKASPADIDDYIRKAMSAFTIERVTEFEILIGLYALTVTHLATGRQLERNTQ